MLFIKAIGLKSDGGNAFVKTTTSGKLIRSILGEDLIKRIENPIIFQYIQGDLGHGYEADLLVDLCNAIDEADRLGKLQFKK